MASFRTHISFGIALGAASVFAVAGLALVPPEWSFYVLIGLAVTVGALLPDIDSDSGLPFHVTFGSLSLIASGLAFWYALQRTSDDYGIALVSAVGALVIVWGGFGPIFKRFTRHRGMIHSVPVALIAGLVFFSIVVRVGFDTWKSFLLGLALVVGYVLHLVLDELNSAINFHGTLFMPNKAFGSALKFVSKYRSVNIATYASLAILVVINYRELMLLCLRLWEAMGV